MKPRRESISVFTLTRLVVITFATLVAYLASSLNMSKLERFLIGSALANFMKVAKMRRYDDHADFAPSLINGIYRLPIIR